MPTGISYLDETWNMILGCKHASKGCNNCWAEAVSHAHSSHPNPKISDAYKGVTKDGKWTGTVKCLEDRLKIPLHWEKPRVIGVSFMGDLFHKDVPFEFIDRVFSVMSRRPQHTFIILTKRPDRMREYISGFVDGSNKDRVLKMSSYQLFHATYLNYRRGIPLSNVWLGVSVSNQDDADKYLPDLLSTPATNRLVSLEPSLGHVDLSHYMTGDKWYMAKCEECGFFASSEYFNGDDESISCPKCYSEKIEFVISDKGVDLVIMGGQGGPNADPMHPDWPRSMRDQCKETDTGFYFKQWGEYLPFQIATTMGIRLNGEIVDVQSPLRGGDDAPGSVEMIKVPKKKAGHLLDGVEHRDLPWQV